jgi:hypothetical protein
MPTNKDFKRVVRARMTKTGESYTAARAQLLRNTSPASTDYASLAGKSDAAIEKATGCTWERWVYALDRAKASEWPHRDIATYVQQKYKVSDWWAQSVTVGYERIKGLRVPGQRRDGSYEATKSKVIAVPVGKLYGAVSNAAVRAQWLDVPLDVTSASKNKSMRARFPDGTPLDFGFVGKGEAKSQVALGHRKLKSPADATRMKAFWTEKLNALAELLSSREAEA